MKWILIPLEALGVILLADFVTGFVHWLEDAYGQPDFPITGKLITQPNILHHTQPRAFVRKNWWQSSWDLLLMHLAIVAIATFTGHLGWQVVLFAIIGANANQFHKWAHKTPRENGKLVTFLQRRKIIQGTRHHAKHHTDPKNSHYCTITVLVNPIVDGVRLWDGLEWAIEKVFGLRRRVDPSVKVHTNCATCPLHKENLCKHQAREKKPPAWNSRFLPASTALGAGLHAEG